MRATGLLLVLTLLASCSKRAGEGSAAIEINATVGTSGEVHFTETIRLTRVKGRPLPPLSRQLWVNPATFPLRQQVLDLRVRDSDGRPLRHRQRAYGDWVNIDLLEIPGGQTPTIVLDYRVRRALAARGERVALRWQLVGSFWNVPVTSLELAVSLPAHVSRLDQIEQRVEVDYKEYAGPKPALSDGVYRWQLGEQVKAGKPVRLELRFPRGDVRIAQGYFADLISTAGIIPWVLGLLFVLAFALRLAPARVAIAVTPVINAIAAAAVLFELGRNARYWLYEATYRGGELDNVASEQIGFIGFAVILIGFAVVQQRGLRRGDRRAYFAQLAWPVALALPMPMFGTNPALLFVPLLGIPALLYWPRRAIALQFGAGMHRLLEAINTEGELTFTALANRLGIAETQLARILDHRPGLPVVVDHEARVVYSPAVAALREQMLICPACGAGTQTKGQELVSCGHCDRDYAASRQAKPRSPTPVFVDAIGAVFEMFGIFFFVWAALILVVFSVLAMFDGGASIGVAIVVALVIAAPGYALYDAGDKLRRGKRTLRVNATLLATAPLVVPAIAFWRLGRARNRLFFGSYPPARIAERLHERGELSLAELAAMLETDVDEASEVARYLTGSELIDAVFDRSGNRLVARQAYRTMAKTGACTRCGGVLGVIGGQAACHHCGEPA